jgi:hypothetical protein
MMLLGPLSGVITVLIRFGFHHSQANMLSALLILVRFSVLAISSRNSRVAIFISMGSQFLDALATAATGEYTL